MKKKPQEAFRKSDKIVRVVSSAKFIISLAVIIGVGTFLAWQYHNTTNADRVFWGMVDENLQTSAYSRNTVQKSGSQTVTQVIQTETSPKQLIYSQTVFEQTGVDSATAITENIGTPTEDYVRYNSIVTSQKSANGDPLDFSDVVGQWAAAGSSADGETTGQQYNQAVLGIIPTGNLSSAERRAIIKTMKEQGTYQYSVVETKRTWPFGRPNYTFQVTVNPEGYITTLKQFAKEVGLNHLEQVQPADYASSQKLTFIVSVDGWTHQMTRADQNQGARSETISGRNLKNSLPSAPTETIPVDELQARLQSVQ
jgi:hypothetical protein